MRLAVVFTQTGQNPVVSMPVVHLCNRKQVYSTIRMIVLLFQRDCLEVDAIGDTNGFFAENFGFIGECNDGGEGFCHAFPVYFIYS